MKKIIKEEKEIRFCDVPKCKNRAVELRKNFYKDLCYQHEPLFSLAYHVAENSLKQNQRDEKNKLAQKLFDMMLPEYNKSLEL